MKKVVKQASLTFTAILLAITLQEINAQTPEINMLYPLNQSTSVSLVPQICFETNYPIDTTSIKWDHGQNYNYNDPTCFLVDDKLRDSLPDSLLITHNYYGSYQLINDTTLAFYPGILSAGRSYYLKINGIRVLVNGVSTPVDSLEITFTAIEEPASFVQMRFSSQMISDNHSYPSCYPGDTIIFELTNGNHDMGEVNGKVSTAVGPLLEIVRIDSIVYDPVLGRDQTYETAVDYVSNLSGDRRFINCVIPEWPSASLSPINNHRVRIHLSDATGDIYGDRDAAFRVWSGYIVKSIVMDDHGDTLDGGFYLYPNVSASGFLQMYNYSDTIRIAVVDTVSGYCFDHWECIDIPTLHRTSNRFIEYVVDIGETGVKRRTAISAIYRKLESACVYVGSSGAGEVRVFDSDNNYLGGAGLHCVDYGRGIQIVAKPDSLYDLENWQSDLAAIDGDSTEVIYVNPTTMGAVDSITASFELAVISDVITLKTIMHDLTDDRWKQANPCLFIPYATQGVVTATDQEDIVTVGIDISNINYYIVGYEYDGIQHLISKSDPQWPYDDIYTAHVRIGNGGTLAFLVKRKEYKLQINQFVCDPANGDVDSTLILPSAASAFVAGVMQDPSPEGPENKVRSIRTWPVYAGATYKILIVDDPSVGCNWYGWYGSGMYLTAPTFSIREFDLEILPASYSMRDTLKFMARFMDSFKCVKVHYSSEMRPGTRTTKTADVVELGGATNVQYLAHYLTVQDPNHEYTVPFVDFEFNQPIDQSSIMYYNGRPNLITNVYAVDNVARVDWTNRWNASSPESAPKMIYRPLNGSSGPNFTISGALQNTNIEFIDNKTLRFYLVGATPQEYLLGGAEYQVVPMPKLMDFNVVIGDPNCTMKLKSMSGRELQTPVRITGFTEYPEVRWHADATYVIENTDDWSGELFVAFAGAIMSAEEDEITPIELRIPHTDNSYQIPKMEDFSWWIWNDAYLFNQPPLLTRYSRLHLTGWLVDHDSGDFINRIGDLFKALETILNEKKGILLGTKKFKDVVDPKTGEASSVLDEAATIAAKVAIVGEIGLYAALVGKIASWMQNWQDGDDTVSEFEDRDFTHANWFGCHPQKKMQYRMWGTISVLRPFNLVQVPVGKHDKWATWFIDFLFTDPEYNY